VIFEIEFWFENFWCSKVLFLWIFFSLVNWRHNEYFYSQHTISMLNLSSLWVGAFMVAVPQQESWHSVLSLDIRFQQNECFEMLNNERGICMFKLSLTNNCYNEWFELIEQILNVLFKYKPKKKMHDYKTWFPKMGYFHLECQNLIKTSNNVIFLHPCLLYFFPNFWNAIL